MMRHKCPTQGQWQWSQKTQTTTSYTWRAPVAQKSGVIIGGMGGMLEVVAEGGQHWWWELL